MTDTEVVLGPDTLVTADDNALLTNLTPSSIAVGDHITARGIINTGFCAGSVDPRLHRHHEHQYRLGAPAGERRCTGRSNLRRPEVW